MAPFPVARNRKDTRSQERKGTVQDALRRFHYSRCPRNWSETAHEVVRKKGETKTAQCIVHCAVSISRRFLVTGQKTHTRSQERKARPRGAVLVHCAASIIQGLLITGQKTRTGWHEIKASETARRSACALRFFHYSSPGTVNADWSFCDHIS